MESTEDREAALRHALISDPRFVSQSIQLGDRANLVEGFTKADPQQCWDAIHDLVEGHANEQERRFSEAYYHCKRTVVLERMIAWFGISGAQA